MRITITIDCDNAAFDIDSGGPEQECARILQSLAREWRDGLSNVAIGRRKLRDINGNTVGKVEVS